MVMRKRARHICSTTRVRMWPREKFALSVSTCWVPHHSHRLLHPLFGFLCRHHARAVCSSGGGHFLLHTSATQSLQSKELAERGQRNSAGTGSCFREDGKRRGTRELFVDGPKRPGAVSGVGDGKHCCSCLVHAPFLRSGDQTLREQALVVSGEQLARPQCFCRRSGPG